MGILARPAQIVEEILVPLLPKGFSVIELGDQFYRADGGKALAESWYQRLGAGRYACIDGNGRGHILADLNYPIPAKQVGTHDLVTDFGTGEHVFNQAQIFATLHDLCKVGGYILIDRPKTGWAESCFFNIHETLIKDLACTNDYDLVHMETYNIADHGDVLFSILRKAKDQGFMFPQQGKYRARLTKLREIAALKRWQVLEQLVNQNGWTTGAEIGVLNGATYFHLLDNCPGLRSLVAVDAWASDAPEYGDLTAVGRDFVNRARSYGDRSCVLLGRSMEMADHVQDGSLDFVFIDADHSFEAVAGDLNAWVPKVRNGGAVLGHDIDRVTVRKAVQNFFGNQGAVTPLPDDVWAVLK